MWTGNCQALVETNKQTKISKNLMENEEARRDELEALAAIYADDWAVEDARSGSYSLTLAANTTKGTKKWLKIVFKLPPGYPAEARPLFELSAPWMDREEKAKLVAEIEDLCRENSPGGSILYMIAEVAQQKLGSLLETETEEGGEIKVEEIELEDENSRPTKTEIEDEGEKRHSQQINISHGDPFLDRRSTFQAHLAAVRSPSEARAVLAQLLENRKIASATHNMWAYRIAGSTAANGANQSLQQDCDDDGETHAGSRLLHLLQIAEARNVMVVVSRWYGGVQLGPDRFKHINNVARQLLLSQNYISAK